MHWREGVEERKKVVYWGSQGAQGGARTGSRDLLLKKRAADEPEAPKEKGNFGSAKSQNGTGKRYARKISFKGEYAGIEGKKEPTYVSSKNNNS